MIQLTGVYTSLGETIIHSHFKRDMEWVFHAFIHAFAIEQNAKAILQSENPSACIIPPYHPVILEKMQDQSVFLLDGVKEWMENHMTEYPSFERIRKAVDELAQLCRIQEGMDILPGKNGYFGIHSAYANYCLYGKDDFTLSTSMKSIMRRDAVFNDDFKENVFREMNPTVEMLADVIESYVRTMPNTADNLSIAVISPDDFQPVIAAVYRHITRRKILLSNPSRRIQLCLNILVPPEDKGGCNYLSYWVNTAFTQDENIDVRIYLNDWKTRDDLNKLLPSNLDLLFLMNVLKVDRLRFVKDHTSDGQSGISDCRFPIVYKTSAVTAKNIRQIELTQKQFKAVLIHSQVVYYRGDYELHTYQPTLAVREVSIDDERQYFIEMLHKKANWAVCVDGGMDGALLRGDGNSIGSDAYDIIGFSTGRGTHAQYNLTITARQSIVSAVEKRLKARLKCLFHWDDAVVKNAAGLCMREARKLDGVSLFSAINPNDENIRAFLAYLLSSFHASDAQDENSIQMLIHLDSYRHWFSGSEPEQNTDAALRPDFLFIRLKTDENGKLFLHATVIECKIAKCNNAHYEKAFRQVKSGIERLSRIFNPRSQSVRRRYWFAQLYRALSFSQITFHTDSISSEKHQKIAAVMRGIPEGQFEIDWSGEIMCYWLDMPGTEELVTHDSMTVDSRVFPDEPYEIPIELHEIPQEKIQRLLLSNFPAHISFVPYTEETEIQSGWIQTQSGEAELQSGWTNPEDAGMKNPEDNTVFPEMLSPMRQETLWPEESLSMLQETLWSDETLPQNQSEILPENAPCETVKTPLSQIRVFIGKDRAGNDVFWDFGHPQLPNRHILITGTSGQGKTYSIQTMLKELSQNGVSSVIFDYTEGFRTDQLEKPFRDALADRIHEQIVYCAGVPVNPFRRYEIEISGMKMREKISDVAQRIANIFAHVYDFREQQFSAIYEACRTGMEEYGDNMNMARFKEKLVEVKNPAAKTVQSKMAPFLDSVDFHADSEFDWGKIIKSHGTVTIFQLTHFIREFQVIITEFMLWDAWHYNKKYGDKMTPFVVVLDEAQNLSHKADSPSAMILTEGRKFGWSAWFATQSLKVLDDDEIIRLQQASFKLYFKPADDELQRVAKQLDLSGGGTQINNLRLLRKGQAIVAGDRTRPDSSFGHVPPVIATITSFEEREKYGRG